MEGSIESSLEFNEEVVAEEEEHKSIEPEPEPVPVCKCLRDASEDKIIMSARKQAIFTTAARTESYIRDRKIQDFINFLLTKLISDLPDKPISYFEKLLDDCMLFRAGNGLAPVLYEDRHLQAVIKSFDPGDRGWLSAGQIRRLYNTLDIVLEENIEDRVAVDIVFKNLKNAQEKQLFNLLTAGMNYCRCTSCPSSGSFF